MVKKMMMRIRKYLDIITISIVSIVVTSLLVYLTNFREVFMVEKIYREVFTLFGVFFGALITAYTILTAMHISKSLKDTSAFRRLNTYFLASIYTVILSMILGFSFYFLNSSILFFIQILFSIFSMLMMSYLIKILHQLLNVR